MTNDNQSANKLTQENNQYHRHVARAVRDARKLDIILDEEEENDQEGFAGSEDENISDDRLRNQ